VRHAQHVVAPQRPGRRRRRSRRARQRSDRRQQIGGRLQPQPDRILQRTSDQALHGEPQLDQGKAVDAQISEAHGGVVDGESRDLVCQQVAEASPPRVGLDDHVHPAHGEHRRL
jgi:hypothetical protein